MPRNVPLLIASWLTVLFPLSLLMGSGLQDTVMSIIAVMFLLHSLLTKDWDWCAKGWVRCLALLWAYMMARGALADAVFYHADAAGFAKNAFQALRRSVPFARYFVFAAALAYGTLPEATVRRRFFVMLAASVLLLALDCLLQRALGHDILGHTILHDPAGHLRLTGPFRSPMPGVLLAWIFFPACMPLLVSDAGVLHRGRPLFAALAICLLALVAILLSGERMALLLALAGWAVAIVLLPGCRRPLFALLVAGVVVLGAIAALSPDVLSRQVESTGHTLGHWQQSPYGMLLHSDLLLAVQHPVFGAGTNYFRLLCPKLYPGYNEAALAAVCNVHPHNIYLEWWIENGAIGFALFITFLACVVRECVRAWPQVRVNPYWIGGVIALAMRVWPFASSTSFFSPWGSPPFWLAVAIVLAFCLQPQKMRERLRAQ